MTILRIDKSRGGWESVPRRLFDDRRLSLDTRGVAGFLATRTDNFTLSAPGLRALLKLGKERYERVASELESAGYLERIQGRDARGRMRWEMIFRPEPTGGFPTKVDGTPYPKKTVRPPRAKPPVVQPSAVGQPTTRDLGQQDTQVPENHHQERDETGGGGIPALWEMTADFELAQACLMHEIRNKAGYRKSILERYRRENGPEHTTISEMEEAARRAADQSRWEELAREKHDSVVRQQQENDARRAAIWSRILALKTEERNVLYSKFMNSRPDLSTAIREAREPFISSGTVTRPTVKMALIAFAASWLSD